MQRQHQANTDVTNMHLKNNAFLHGWILTYYHSCEVPTLKERMIVTMLMSVKDGGVFMAVFHSPLLSPSLSHLHL